jgi:hypothetical protein
LFFIVFFPSADWMMTGCHCSACCLFYMTVSSSAGWSNPVTRL